MRDEVIAALAYEEKLGGDTWQIEILGAWNFVELSQIKPFAFLQSLFDLRAAQPKGSVLSIVLKLGINSVYGKLAQAIGTMGKAPSSANPWYAAAITAGTRAQLLIAALQKPHEIVMLATDGIISQSPLQLECPAKKSLGTWEQSELSKGGLFVQSGVYSISDANGNFASKSRGFRPDNISSGETLSDYLISTVPPLWKTGSPALSFKYNFYQTLGSAIASEGSFAFIGMWGSGHRDLDLQKSGVKRVTDPRQGKRRASRLVASRPSQWNMTLMDENGGLAISAPSMPEWLDDDLANEAAFEAENLEIFTARFGD
jgi:hypothetical protein